MMDFELITIEAAESSYGPSVTDELNADVISRSRDDDCARHAAVLTSHHDVTQRNQDACDQYDSRTTSRCDYVTGTNPHQPGQRYSSRKPKNVRALESSEDESEPVELRFPAKQRDEKTRKPSNVNFDKNTEFRQFCSRPQQSSASAEKSTTAERKPLLEVHTQLTPCSDAEQKERVFLPRVRERLRQQSVLIREQSRRWKDRGQARFRSRRGGAHGAHLYDHDEHRGSFCEQVPDSPFTRRANLSAGVRQGGSSGLSGIQLIRGAAGSGKSDVIIHLEREDATYSAGEVIRGHVSVLLTREVKIKDLVLRVQGQSRVSWKEQKAYFRGSASVDLKTQDVILDHAHTLIKPGSTEAQPLSPTKFSSSKRSSLVTLSSGTPPSQGPSQPLQPLQGGQQAPRSDEGLLLTAGSHSFPFDYALPRGLRASFHGKWGQVRYVVKAVLVRPWKFDVERETEVTVHSVHDLNDEPELTRPIGGLSEFNPGWLCIRGGPITVELRTGRRGYVGGESILFYVEIENNSEHKLLSSRVSLVQHVAYRAGRKTRKASTRVVSVERGEVAPNTTDVWSSDSLVVPPGLPASTPAGTGGAAGAAGVAGAAGGDQGAGSRNNIHIKYTVSLNLYRSSQSDNYCLSVPVVLGTVGLRRQTINAYLLSLAQTPRGSPTAGRKESCDSVLGRPGLAGGRPARQSLSMPLASYPPGASLSSPPSTPLSASPLSAAARRPSTASIQSTSAQGGGRAPWPAGGEGVEEEGRGEASGRQASSRSRGGGGGSREGADGGGVRGGGTSRSRTGSSRMDSSSTAADQSEYAARSRLNSGSSAASQRAASKATERVRKRGTSDAVIDLDTRPSRQNSSELQGAVGRSAKKESSMTTPTGPQPTNRTNSTGS